LYHSQSYRAPSLSYQPLGLSTQPRADAVGGEVSADDGSLLCFAVGAEDTVGLADGLNDAVSDGEEVGLSVGDPVGGSDVLGVGAGVPY